MRGRFTCFCADRFAPFTIVFLRILFTAITLQSSLSSANFIERNLIIFRPTPKYIPMETIIDVLQQFQLDILQVLATGIILFLTGYLVGKKKCKKLYKKIRDLQKDVLDLNAELLVDKTRQV